MDDSTSHTSAISIASPTPRTTQLTHTGHKSDPRQPQDYSTLDQKTCLRILMGLQNTFEQTEDTEATLPS